MLWCRIEVELAAPCPAQHAGKQAAPNIQLSAGVLLMLLVSEVLVKLSVPLQVGLLRLSGLFVSVKFRTRAKFVAFLKWGFGMPDLAVEADEVPVAVLAP